MVDGTLVGDLPTRFRLQDADLRIFDWGQLNKDPNEAFEEVRALLLLIATNELGLSCGVLPVGIGSINRYGKDLETASKKLGAITPLLTELGGLVLVGTWKTWKSRPYAGQIFDTDPPQSIWAKQLILNGCPDVQFPADVEARLLTYWTNDRKLGHSWAGHQGGTPCGPLSSQAERCAELTGRQSPRPLHDCRCLLCRRWWYSL